MVCLFLARWGKWPAWISVLVRTLGLNVRRFPHSATSAQVFEVTVELRSTASRSRR